MKNYRVFFATGLLGFIFFMAYRQNRNLRKNFKVAYATVTGVDGATKSFTRMADYTYSVGGQVFKKRSTLPCSSQPCMKFYRAELVGRKLVIVYQTDDPSNSDMLFTMDDFKKFGISPDDESRTLIHGIDSMYTNYKNNW